MIPKQIQNFTESVSAIYPNTELFVYDLKKQKMDDLYCMSGNIYVIGTKVDNTVFTDEFGCDYEYYGDPNSLTRLLYQSRERLDSQINSYLTLKAMVL